MCWERQLTEFCSVVLGGFPSAFAEQKRKIRGIFQGKYQLLTNNIVIKITIFSEYTASQNTCWFLLTVSHILFPIFSVSLSITFVYHNLTCFSFKMLKYNSSRSYRIYCHQSILRTRRRICKAFGLVYTDKLILCV